MENIKDKLHEVIKEARANGVTSINGLAMVLGLDEGYKDLLPVLWKEYSLDSKKNNLIPRKEYDVQKPHDRAAMWFFLLQRWTRSDGGMFKKLNQRLAHYLTLHPNDMGEPVDINLKEFETYIRRELEARYINARFTLPDQLLITEDPQKNISESSNEKQRVAVRLNDGHVEDLKDCYVGWKEITQGINERIGSITTKGGARSFLKRNNIPTKKSPTGRPVLRKQQLDDFISEARKY